MYLCKLASSNVPTNKEDYEKVRNIFHELTKTRYIPLTPGMQWTLGGGAALGGLFNANDRPLLGAIRGAGTGLGFIGGKKGGDKLSNYLLNQGALKDFDDTSKVALRAGIGLGSGVLGAILANNFIKRTTE